VFLSLRTTNAEWVAMKFAGDRGGLIVTTNRGTDYVLGEVVTIGCKGAGYDRKFESTSNRCCHVANAAVEASTVISSQAFVLKLQFILS